MVKKIRLSVTLTRQHMDSLNDLVEKGAYLDKGEAIRAGIMLLFKTHKIEFADEESDD